MNTTFHILLNTDEDDRKAQMWGPFGFIPGDTLVPAGRVDLVHPSTLGPESPILHQYVVDLFNSAVDGRVIDRLAMDPALRAQSQVTLFPVEEQRSAQWADVVVPETGPDGWALGRYGFSRIAEHDLFQGIG